MAKNKFVIECHHDDLNFLLNNYAKISEGMIREFGLPADTMVKLRPVTDGELGRLNTFFNGKYKGDVIIKDERTKAKVEVPDRGLH